ncbi:hypothetical protein GGP93_000856 [Salinibacter ruber]|nr:hypothetical protein [Salinibacter ruber]
MSIGYQCHLRLIQTTGLACLFATNSMTLSATLSPSVVQPSQPIGDVNKSLPDSMTEMLK